jgi:hypothetical protein
MGHCRKGLGTASLLSVFVVQPRPPAPTFPDSQLCDITDSLLSTLPAAGEWGSKVTSKREHISHKRDKVPTLRDACSLPSLALTPVSLSLGPPLPTRAEWPQRASWTPEAYLLDIIDLACSGQCAVGSLETHCGQPKGLFFGSWLHLEEGTGGARNSPLISAQTPLFSNSIIITFMKPLQHVRKLCWALSFTN